MALNPMLNLGMCVIAEMQGLLDFRAVTTLLGSFMVAVKQLYCHKHDIRPDRDWVQTENVDKCLAHVAEQAFKHIVHDKTYFEYDTSDVEDFNITNHEPIFRLGLLTTLQPGTQNVCFNNRSFQEFLAAWHMSRMSDDQFMPYRDMMLNEKHMFNVCMYYCGLLMEDTDNEHLRYIFATLADVNLERWQAAPLGGSFSGRESGSARAPSTLSSVSRGPASARTLSTLSSQDRGPGSAGTRAPTSGRSSVSAQSGTPYTMRSLHSARSTATSTQPQPFGKFNDFSLSLRCVSEVGGRRDLTTPLLASFPPKLTMRHRDVPDIRVISGLAWVLQNQAATVTELELRLDHFATYHEQSFLMLAMSIAESLQLTYLKIYWTNDELLARFLAKVFGNNSSIKRIRFATDRH